MELKERLGKEWLFFDGGTGTILQERGLAAGELPETWNLTHPEEIISLHCGYFEAGSNASTPIPSVRMLLNIRITCVGLCRRQ